MTDVLTKLVSEVAEPAFFNPVFERLHALDRDTPAKAWWNAQAMHPAIFRALRMARNEDGAVYAAMPFRLARDAEGNHCILVALPAPKTFEPDDDWLGIETVLVWHPTRNHATNPGDPEPNQIIGEAGEPGRVYGSAFHFFRAMAEARAQWVTRFLALADKTWKRRPNEPRHIPGLLLLGDPAKVRWPKQLPAELHCHGIDARTVNKAILRQSNLPRAIPAEDLRDAA